MNFNNIIKNYKKLIDAELEKFFIKINKDIKDDFLKLDYSFLREYLRNGKRLRPILLIMAYKAFRDDNKIMPVSISVELLHNSTLIHDDIMDEDDFRRNKPTIYKKLKDFYLKNYKELDYKGPLFNMASSRFSVSNTILCGNILAVLGSNIILNSEFQENLKIKAVKQYNDAYYTVNHGQFLDLILEKKENVAEKDYFEMIGWKTANLFSASIAIGVILADAPNKETAKLAQYIKELAIAFQLIDDIMDISKEMAKGHELGSDIKSGKKTLLIITALEKANKEGKKYLLNILGNKNATKEDINAAVEVIEKTSLDYVRGEADKRIGKARKILEKIDIRKEAKEFFYEFCSYMAQRTK